MLFRFDGFDLDDEIFTLRRGGADVPLRPQALDLLIYLVRNRTRVVTKQELLDAVWRGNSVSENTIAQAVAAVRRALEDLGDEARLVQNVRARGYRFIGQVEASASDEEPQTPAGALPTFVGRAEILDRVDSIVRKAERERVGLLISGARGAGKTRLLAEIAQRARTVGARAVEARCHPEGDAPPLWLWIQLLRGCAEGSASAAAREADRLATEMAKPPAGQGADHGRFGAFDGVAQTLARAAERDPLLLVVDDLQHADSASLLLLKLVASSHARTKLVLVAAHRDGAAAAGAVLSRTLGALARERPACSIRLDNLGAADVKRLAESTLDRTVDDALLQRLMHKTGGNPLLVSQLLEALSRIGRSQTRDEGTTALLAVGEVREAIGVQIEELSDGLRDLLDAASVLGVEFPLPRVAAAMSEPPASLLQRVDEALLARVLAKTAPGSYRFEHVLVRDVVYRKLPVARRVALHMRAGEACLADGDLEASVRHLERALADLGVVPAEPADAPAEDLRARARALLTQAKASA